MSRATRIRPMVASLKIRICWERVSAVAKPKVKREEPLSQKAWPQLGAPKLQNMAM